MIVNIYVGDAADVIRRITSDHCSSNVEGSAYRKHIATAMGFGIRRTKRTRGSTRVRIDLPDPKVGEQKINQYISQGNWQFVLCSSPEEARDFQWYAIEHLRPALNIDLKPWNNTQANRYSELLRQLENSPRYSRSELSGLPSGPGVYLFTHLELPKAIE